ncbi:uncharacterized protein LOC133099100 [Eubalaena glacialis]|uniref:uncharacterized protein LOC133099100 n=1 Tax=Eubalaena glacialis TaxID=27606 RepID=UPI002A5AE6D0|nr:uncharacterized protein LOC133099100 [Eubalaena glacialis]
MESCGPSLWELEGSPGDGAVSGAGVGARERLPDAAGPEPRPVCGTQPANPSCGRTTPSRRRAPLRAGRARPPRGTVPGSGHSRGRRRAGVERGRRPHCSPLPGHGPEERTPSEALVPDTAAKTTPESRRGPERSEDAGPAGEAGTRPSPSALPPPAPPAPLLRTTAPAPPAPRPVSSRRGARPVLPGKSLVRSRRPRGPPDEAALPAGAEHRASRRRRTEAAGGARSGRRLRAAGSGPGPKRTDGQRLVPRPQPQPESDQSVLAADLVTTVRSACVDRLPASFLRPEQVPSQRDQATARRRGSCPVSRGGEDRFPPTRAVLSSCHPALASP